MDDVDWNDELKDMLFTSTDHVTINVIEALRKSREVIRSLRNCSIPKKTDNISILNDFTLPKNLSSSEVIDSVVGEDGGCRRAQKLFLRPGSRKFEIIS